MRNQFYLLAINLFVLSLIAGCSSTSEVAEAPPAQEATVQEEVAVQEPAQVAEPEPEPEMPPATVFYFDYDDATLRPNVREAIEEHAERLKNNSQVVRIEGHADERGTEAYNKELGQRRAEAVRDLLISMGVSSNQIETVSYGENNPDVLGQGEAVWQKNRRVVLK